MRVTDLEEFAETHIWGPYWPCHPDAHQFGPDGSWTGERYRDGIKRLGRRRHNLAETYNELHSHPEWADLVLNRLTLIKVRFPHYIVHPLVDYIRHQVKIRQDRKDRGL